jgi:hypothetical protein
MTLAAAAAAAEGETAADGIEGLLSHPGFSGPDEEAVEDLAHLVNGPVRPAHFDDRSLRDPIVFFLAHSSSAAAIDYLPLASCR